MVTLNDAVWEWHVDLSPDALRNADGQAVIGAVKAALNILRDRYPKLVDVTHKRIIVGIVESA